MKVWWEIIVLTWSSEKCNALRMLFRLTDNGRIMSRGHEALSFLLRSQSKWRPLRFCPDVGSPLGILKEIRTTICIILYEIPPLIQYIETAARCAVWKEDYWFSPRLSQIFVNKWFSALTKGTPAHSCVSPGVWLRIPFSQESVSAACSLSVLLIAWRYAAGVNMEWTHPSQSTQLYLASDWNNIEDFKIPIHTSVLDRWSSYSLPVLSPWHKELLVAVNQQGWFTKLSSIC